jgi:NifU-like protein
MKVEASVAAKPAAPPLRWSAMTMPQRVKRVEAVIEKVRPQLQADHGDIELVEIIDKSIYVSMQGACKGCSMEQATLGGIQQRVLEEFGEFIKVLPASLIPATAAATGEVSHA